MAVEIEPVKDYSKFVVGRGHGKTEHGISLSLLPKVHYKNILDAVKQKKQSSVYMKQILYYCLKTQMKISVCCFVLKINKIHYHKSHQSVWQSSKNKHSKSSSCYFIRRG